MPDFEQAYIPFGIARLSRLLQSILLYYFLFLTDSFHG